MKCTPSGTDLLFQTTTYGEDVSSGAASCSSTLNRTLATAWSSAAFALRVTDPDNVTGPGSVRVTLGAVVSGGVRSVVVLSPPQAATARRNRMKGRDSVRMKR